MAERVFRFISFSFSAIAFASILSCKNAIVYYHSEDLNWGYHEDSSFRELQLNPDSTFRAFEYITDRNGDYSGQLYTGGYYIAGDTLFLIHTNWTLLTESDTFPVNAGKKVYWKYQLENRGIINAQPYSKGEIDPFFLEKGKSRKFRTIEKQDSIFWVLYPLDSFPGPRIFSEKGLE